MRLVIPRDKWLRGEGSDDSYLLRIGDGKMCCLGLYLEQLGVDTRYLEDESSPCSVADMTKEDGNSPYPADAGWLVDYRGTRGYHNSHAASSLMEINDKKYDITEEERERRIAELFKEYGGVEVDFE